MPQRNPSRFRRNCYILFRRLRMCALLLILALVGTLMYLNQVGLPGFVKRPLLARLRERGLDLQFTRLRWHWDHGIVAENVLFGRPDDPSSPKLALKEVEVQLNYGALARLQFLVASLQLRRGRLTWPIPETNGPPRELTVDGIQTELRLLPDDLWQLDHFQAQFAGANIHLAGTITNASAVRRWKSFQAAPMAPAGGWRDRLRQFADAVEGIHFASPPLLSVNVRGDARNLRSFSVRASLNAPSADTPWGTVRRGLLAVRLIPATNREPVQAEATLQAGDVQTRWGSTTNLALALRLVSPARDTDLVHANLDVTAVSVATTWGRAANAHFTAHWIHSLTNALPLSGRGELYTDNAEGRWGSASNLQLVGTLAAPANRISGDASWSWWTNLAPYALGWECRVAGLHSPRLQAQEFSCTGQWQAPELQATQVAARLYDGRLIAQADLNVATRELGFTVASDFDIHKISALLTPASRRWLSEYSWKQPPELQGEGRLVLPAWTNRHPDWRAEVKPTLALRGHFHVEDGAFRGVPAAGVDSHFTYTNEVWRLPDLVVTRPEGRLELVHQSDERTHDYYFGVHSTIDVRALRPLLEPRAQRALDLVGFTQPPLIDGEVRGRWHEPERIGLQARVALTNFTFRGESADGFETAVAYTNRFLRLLEPRLQRGTQQLAAAGVSVDFVNETVGLSNGFSTADPLVVARAIGPKIGEHLKPYRFLQAPVVRVQGIIPFHGETKADLHFDVDGGPFAWWKFQVPRISAKLDWVQRRLALRNVQAEFYDGAGVGNAAFDFRPAQGTDFRFETTVADADFHLLMGDLLEQTNQLEGRLTAQLAITNGNLADWQSWQGSGQVDLRDGLIWQIPVFGILSPVLDGILPGLGSSRAKEGSAAFVITNGVVRSDDLEIKASGMRLQYWGTVDMKGRLDARVEAELLRDTWVLGRVLSLALWPVSKIFEYRITGTLHQPRSDPVFIVPRIVLLPFHPVRSVKDLFPQPPDFTRTNAPPVVTPP